MKKTIADFLSTKVMPYLGKLTPSLVTASIVLAGIWVFSSQHQEPPKPPPIIDVPSSLTVDVGRMIVLSAKSKYEVAYQIPPECCLDAKQITGHDLALSAYKPGTFYVGVLAATAKNKVTDTIWVRIIAGKPPTPTPPDPPVPPLPPVPPQPPQPPAPIALDGFRVLVIYDAKKETTYPEEQQEIIYSQDVRDWLSSKCAKGQDGKTPEFRIFKVGTTGAEKHWMDAMALPRDGEPWMIVSNGKTGWKGPLPKTKSEAMEIWKKYLPTN